ncbi:hypothetical protein EJB05_50399, partial [Eragrostis curvula]
MAPLRGFRSRRGLRFLRSNASCGISGVKEEKGIELYLHLGDGSIEACSSPSAASMWFGMIYKEFDLLNKTYDVGLLDMGVKHERDNEAAFEDLRRER